MSRRWDAGTYDRVSDPLVRMGGDVLARLELRGDETVIDAGCGTGRVTEQLLGRLPHGRVVALDVSAAMLEEAAVRLERYRDRVTLLEADLNLPLPVAEPVDALLSTATFHWVLAQEALPGHLAAVLRPGGQLVAQCGGEGNCADVFAALEALGERPLERLRFLGPEVAARRYEAAGFTDVRAWLTPEPVTFATREELEAYLATVFLGPLTDRPADALPALAHEVADRLPGPVIGYVRLNLVARRG
ncbi:MAG: class I SAM-dependent methyltransferase [Chloroflexota bacterium]